MIISFNWTSLALLAGEKSVTRRDWKWQHRDRIRDGDVLDAWDFSPRVKGRPIGKIRVLSIDRQPISEMPDSDYEAEGFAYIQSRYGGYTTSRESFKAWRESPIKLFVVRFEPVEMHDWLMTDEEWMATYEKRALPAMARTFDLLKKRD